MTRRHHDALFKTAFERPEDAAALARCHLSDSTCAAIRWSTMARESGSFIDEELADRHSDLLFSVTTDVGEAFVYLLFEHQSRLDARMPFRILRYMVRIWERFDKQNPNGPLPAIIPLLICHTPGGWTSPRLWHGPDGPLEFFTSSSPETSPSCPGSCSSCRPSS